MKATYYFPADPAEPCLRIPDPIKIQLVQLLRYAYVETDNILNNNPILWKFGHKSLSRGMLRYIVANNSIRRAVGSGYLPGQAFTRPCGRGGAEFMEYVYDRIGVTLARTHNRHELPRKSDFRVNSAYGNQAMMDLGFSGEGVDKPVDASLVLTHGGDTLNFATLLLLAMGDKDFIVLHESPNLALISDATADIFDVVGEIDIDEVTVTLRDEFKSQQSQSA